MVSPPKFTLEQYFAYDGLFEFRLEYHAGRILPVEIPEHHHTLILKNVTWEIRRQLEDGFTSLFENQRLRPAPEHYVYADLALIRDAPQFADDRVDTLLNARAIIEVSSPGSWTHDYVTKGGLYRKMPGCLEYWLIHCDDIKAEHWTRTGVKEWRIQFIEDSKAALALESLGIEFPLALAYRGTGFVEVAAAPPPLS
ncbi:MAG: Uma2 family endonuclease [Bryobacteraceae bacterium]